MLRLNFMLMIACSGTVGHFVSDRGNSLIREVLLNLQ